MNTFNTHTTMQFLSNNIILNKLIRYIEFNCASLDSIEWEMTVLLVLHNNVSEQHYTITNPDSYTK